MKLKMIRGASMVMVFLVIFSPIQAPNIHSVLTTWIRDVLADEPEDLHIENQRVVWNNDTDLSIYRVVYLESNAFVTIEPGTMLHVRKIVLANNSFIEARGTFEEPIKIIQIPQNETDWQCYQNPSGVISFEQGWRNESLFSYVTFENMGTYIDMEAGGYNCAPMAYNDPASGFLIQNVYAEKPAEYYDKHDTNGPIKSAPAIYYESGRVTMTNCTFTNNDFADVLVNMELYDEDDQENQLVIKNSNFGTNKKNLAVRSRVVKNHAYADYFDDQFDTCYRSFPPGYPWWLKSEFCSNQTIIAADNNESLFDDTHVILENNWYGHKNGPDTSRIEWGGQGDRVYGNFTLNGFRPTSDMASNVLFLPGIKASRLDLDTGDQVWLPESEEDTNYLEMNNNGESMYNIHAKNIVEDAYSVVPVYDEFVEDLTNLKESNVITDYSLYAYDWRYDVEDIAKNCTKYPNGEIKKPIDEIWRLAQSSVSGKVTIVAHSNGGLLAKAIMQELERQMQENGMEEYEMPIDNIITVSSPQMGTPKAIATMLHGYDEKIGKSFVTLMSDEQSRYLVNNMPGAYGLLPSKEYFARTQEPLITFDATIDQYKEYKKAYGKDIDSFDEFRDFVLAKKDGREKPAHSDLISANVLNEKIFDMETQMHDHLDAWTPPENVRLIQIGGWGLDTVRKVTYKMKSKDECKYTVFGKICAPTGEFESFYEPEPTVDGDGTVTTPSSLMLPVEDNVKRYWVDLYRYNDEKSEKNKHVNIMEIESLRNLLSKIITIHKLSEALPQHVSKYRPKDYEGAPPRIRMSLYSPLDIHLYDEHGNHTGPITTTIDGEEKTIIEENIPNSYYTTVGEQKYVGWGTSDSVRVELDGYEEGSYTIKLQEVFVTQDSEDIGDTTEFTSLPTSAQTTVDFTVPADGIQNMSKLTADYDGDGVIDYMVTPQINGSTTLSGDQIDNETTDDDKNDTTQNNAQGETAQNAKKEKKKEYKKASITNWSAYKYTTKSESCPEKLSLMLTGKHFDKDAIIRIGDVKAKKVKIFNSKKLTAIFCVHDLYKVKTGLLRTISITNPHTKSDKAEKKIDIKNVNIMKK